MISCVLMPNTSPNLVFCSGIGCSFIMISAKSTTYALSVSFHSRHFHVRLDVGRKPNLQVECPYRYFDFFTESLQLVFIQVMLILLQVSDSFLSFTVDGPKLRLLLQDRLFIWLNDPSQIVKFGL
jgi:hypothetical protein